MTHEGRRCGRNEPPGGCRVPRVWKMRLCICIAAVVLSCLPSGAALHLTSGVALPSGLPPRVAPRRSIAMPGMAAPAVLPLAAACTLPTLLGYWKSEYGVSYAYGAAMLTTGAMALSAAPAGANLVRAHASCVALYGLRLNLFLLYRELCIPRFREFRENIEARATARGSRLARTPFILSCSLLYLGMACPLVIVGGAASLGRAGPFLVAAMCECRARSNHRATSHARGNAAWCHWPAWRCHAWCLGASTCDTRS